jgi:hypothetical protein
LPQLKGDPSPQSKVAFVEVKTQLVAGRSIPGVVVGRVVDHAVGAADHGVEHGRGQAAAAQVAKLVSEDFGLGKDGEQ